MHQPTDSLDETAHAVDVVRPVAEECISNAPSATFAAAVVTTRLVLQTSQPVRE